ncbi:hypothetical protein PHLH7_26370 [Pseudomonas sp. Ost2]|uniref:hypothetical protein n=1 Tax=Pseudomonas sp. Ost2 TaxID=2678260 RepID=UPI001BEFD19D|nr:hypothetical protein [Pseudomonas sp. Ost2]BBP76533.1 hypothetical protein PHLH7_26370 [Pseudomonas sp. Ost2]
MSSPKLVVSKEDGSILFDTRYIAYGLKKSGYLQYLQSWSRRTFKGGNVDPAWGGNWNESVVTGPNATSDNVYGFTLVGAKSPIVFIVGPGCRVGSTRNPDGSITFYYCGVTTAVKYYCFDLMSDDIPGGPYLKTYLENGDISFNSLQPPLNVVQSIMAPPPYLSLESGTPAPYLGGGKSFTESPRSAYFYYTFSLTAGVEYAVHLPWSRGGGLIMGTEAPGPGFGHSTIEGAYGGIGTATFMFGPAAGGQASQSRSVSQTTWLNTASAPRPSALVVNTAGLPFPYN